MLFFLLYILLFTDQKKKIYIYIYIMDMVVIDMAIFLVSTFSSRTYSKN